MAVESVAPETGKSREIPADDKGFDRGALEASTASALADVFKDDSEEVVETETSATPEKATTSEEKPEEKTEEVEKEEPKEAAATPAKEPAEPTPATLIPAQHRRSLKANGWDDAEIDAAAKANPEGFAKIAERTHASRVAETQRWAEIGKAAKAQEKPPEEVKATPFDLKKLREKYGNEPFIDAMEAMAAQLDGNRSFVEESRKRQQQAELESLDRNVEAYFTSSELKPYADHYGKAGAMKPEQEAARTKVLETADLLLRGARSMGRPMTLDEALTMAHDSVSAPIKEKAAVKKVEAAVKVRQQSITLRPGSRAGAAPATSRRDLETKVGEGLKKAFAR